MLSIRAVVLLLVPICMLIGVGPAQDPKDPKAEPEKKLLKIRTPEDAN